MKRENAVIARSEATKQSRRGRPSHGIASPALTSGPLAMTGGIVIAGNMTGPSLRDAKRRSNPEEGRSPLDCFASLAMTTCRGGEGGSQ
ncbi:MAG: hypothetical protein LBT00_09815 [Spirochaetaceae bacterium]|nr:hypothetical protein [Spirochaetaceae bacterium]